MTASARIERILILGGTIEARRLADALAGRQGLAVTLSLAGRTSEPLAQAVPMRRGGFGGAEGLAKYLRAERIDLLIDATHPYSDAISANAARAAELTGVRLLAIHRPPWQRVDGDNWIDVADAANAARALGEAPRKVFLALGRSELAPFATCKQHFYLVRSVDPVDPPLAVPHATYITGRGPFTEAADRALLEEHHIEIVVAKNSGGRATYGKIAASRAIGIPVIMIKRPPLPGVPSVATVEEALAWLDHAGTEAEARGV